MYLRNPESQRIQSVAHDRWRRLQLLCVAVIALALPAQLWSQVNWTLEDGCDSLRPGEDVQWDIGGVVQPQVLRLGERLLMFYSGSTNSCNSHEIGQAVSEDGGCTWEKTSFPSLSPTLPWEAGGIGGPTVVAVEDRYRMWYWNFVECDRIPGAIGLAESDDPLDPSSWSRIQDEPVVGVSQAWEVRAIGNQTVTYDGTTYRMWYNDGGLPTIRIGYAESVDGLAWKKFAANPVLSDGLGAATPSVSFDESTGTYEMWYTRIRDANADDLSLAYATSLDGLEWAKGGDVVIAGEVEDALEAFPSVLLFRPSWKWSDPPVR